MIFTLFFSAVSFYAPTFNQSPLTKTCRLTTQGGVVDGEEKEFALVVDGSTLAHILPDEAVVGKSCASLPS